MVKILRATRSHGRLLSRKFSKVFPEEGSIIKWHQAGGPVCSRQMEKPESDKAR